MPGQPDGLPSHRPGIRRLPWRMGSGHFRAGLGGTRPCRARDASRKSVAERDAIRVILFFLDLDLDLDLDLSGRISIVFFCSFHRCGSAGGPARNEICNNMCKYIDAGSIQSVLVYLVVQLYLHRVHPERTRIPCCAIVLTHGPYRAYLYTLLCNCIDTGSIQSVLVYLVVQLY